MTRRTFVICGLAATGVAAGLFADRSSTATAAGPKPVGVAVVAMEALVVP